MSEELFDKLLTEIRAEFTKRGIGTFIFLIQDPDSDFYGGETSDKVWALGAMRLRSLAIETQIREEL